MYNAVLFQEGRELITGEVSGIVGNNGLGDSQRRERFRNRFDSHIRCLSRIWMYLYSQRDYIVNMHS